MVPLPRATVSLRAAKRSSLLPFDMSTAVALPSDSGPRTPPPSFPARLHLLAADIKLAHSIFAMPFAILASFMARDSATSWGRFAAQLAIVILCMIFARTWAMLINRLADRRLDADNPRTARRALAAGKVSATFGRAAAIITAIGFIAAAALFLIFDNPWPIMLSIPVLAWIALYSFTKRFTALCHLFLGGALAASPLAAAIAIRPDALIDTPALYWLAAMVLVWVAGFDIIYALQDIETDQRQELFSIPSRLGPATAITISRLFHAAAFAALIVAAFTDPRLGLIFAIGITAVGGLLITEHAILARRGKAGLNMAFFTINGIVSCILSAAGIIDIML